MSAAIESDQSQVLSQRSPMSVLHLLAEHLSSAQAKASDDWYEQAIQSLPAAVCVCDSSGAVRWFSRRAVELLGRAPDVAHGQHVETWLQPTAGLNRDLFLDLVASPRSRRDLVLMLQPEGRPSIRVNATIEAIRTEGDRSNGCVVVVAEVSERSERHVATLGRLAEDLIGAQSEAEVIRMATRVVGETLQVQRCGFVENERGGALRAIAGWTSEPMPTLAGRYDPQSLGDADWRRSLGSSLIAIDDVARHAQTRDFADYYRARGVRAYAAAPVILEGRWAATLVVTHHEPHVWATEDLAILQQTALRVWPLVERLRSQSAFQLMSTNAPVVLAYLDRDSRIKFANRAFAARWGYGIDELPGKPLADVIGNEAFGLLLPHVARVLSGEAVQIEQEMPYRKLGERYVRISLSPDRADDGEVRGYFTAVSDFTERRHTEVALAESEERFRVLAEHAPVGIFQTDRDGACVFANEQWCLMSGLPLNDARGAGWKEAVHPDDRARVEAERQAAVRDGTRFSCEFRFLRRDGVVIWVQGAAVEFRDPLGEPLGMIGTVVDITERKAAEFALRESEKRFRLVASRAPVGIFMSDPDGRTIFVNASWCAMAGMSAEEAQGFGWTHAMHPDDRERVAQEWQHAVKNGASSKAEFRFLRRDGTVTWVHGVAVQVRDTNGRLTGYIGTVADFTERKQAELALRDSEERFRMLADNIMQFAWVCDPSGRWTWVNRRLLEYGGLTFDEVNAGGFAGLHDPAHYDRVMAKFQRHLESGEPWEDTFPLRDRHGTYRWFLSRAIPIRDGTGRVTHWFGTNTDITDWRETQEMLRKAQEELMVHTGDLEKKIEARTASLREAIVQMEEFSYSVSHDLRAPLRAMNGYAEALVEDYGAQLDDTARDYLRRIQRSSQRMEKLTHDVLTYSRIARAEIQLAPVDLVPILRDIISQYAELHPIAAEVEIEHPLLPVMGHELSIGQALANLLTNAAKFVAPGIRPEIRVATRDMGATVRVSVVDNGIGIAREHQPRLFQVFERVPTLTPYEGTGIGLAIVRKAIEKMGGRYGVESDGHHGTCFWFELPKPPPTG